MDPSWDIVECYNPQDPQDKLYIYLQFAIKKSTIKHVGRYTIPPMDPSWGKGFGCFRSSKKKGTKATSHGKTFVRNGLPQVSAWAQDPEVQQRAKHYATEAARAAGQASKISESDANLILLGNKAIY